MLGRIAIISAGVALAVTSAAAAKPASASAAVVAVIHQFIDSFDRGDVKTAAATLSADAVILDEVPPYVWRGPNAIQAWAGDLQKAGQAAGDTEEKVTLGRPVRVNVTGDTAYAVIRATFSYTEKGQPMTEPGQMVYALRKAAGSWKIAGWAWTGGVPRKAPAAPAATPAKP